MSDSADIIVIGAGHNGLVCAGYLAKAGLDVLVLERSHRVGGACVTEELVPGYRFSTFAYSAHGPGPKVCLDLEVPADAFSVEPVDPGLFCPFPDGDHILLWADADKTAAGLDRFGPREGEGYLLYLRFLQQAVAMAQDWFLRPPMTPAQLYERYRATPKADILETLLTRSHWDVLCDYFDSPRVRAALARADDLGDPTAVGSLLAEVMEQASTGAGVQNLSGVVRGGMGMITQALAAAARRFGAEVRTECSVERIVVEHGRAVGVRLESGRVLRARQVVSNADPKRTFLRLLGADDVPADFRRQVHNLKTRAGYMKYHAILSAVPRFTAMPADLAGNARATAGARIAPSLEYYQRAWLDAQSGVPAREPVMSLQLPTAYTPEMAPPGKHTFGAWVRYAPARPRECTWEELREPTTRAITQVIARYAPGFPDLIEWQQLYTPADIERETGITDASIRHVDMTLDQMLHRRPLPAWAAYRTPLEGLWLCGSGTHPCGSVTGGPGHNAAQALLEALHLPGQVQRQ
jgi:phytoene dehydrogenase-like protein